MKKVKEIAIEHIKKMLHDQIFDKENTEMSDEGKQTVYETLSGVAVQSFELGYNLAQDEPKLVSAAALASMLIDDEDVKKIKERMKELGIGIVGEEEK